MTQRTVCVCAMASPQYSPSNPPYRLRFLVSLADTSQSGKARVFLEARSSTGATALFVACMYAECLPCAAALLGGGADANASTTEGLTPVHAAARAGHSATVALLLKAGAKAALRSKRGDSPLHYAARYLPQPPVTLTPF